MTSVSFDPIPIWLPSRGGYTALSFRVDAWRLPLIPNPLLTLVVVNSFANGVQFVGFDPYSLAFQLMVRLVQEWLSCEQEESELGIKRGQELCVHVDSYCGRKVGGVCTVMKQRHCCFNSKLAKIINRGARAQLGLRLDTCEGLNQAQFEAVDFSKIDFDEFIRDIAPVSVPDATLQDRARRALTRQPTAQPSVTNYYEEP